MSEQPLSPVRLPTREEMCARFGAEDGELPLLVHDGYGGVQLVVPANFYELEESVLWDQYFGPIYYQLRAAHEGRLKEIVKT